MLSHIRKDTAWLPWASPLEGLPSQEQPQKVIDSTYYGKPAGKRAGLGALEKCV